MGVFYFAEDEGAVERADAVEFAEYTEQEFLIRFHVAGIDFEQEIMVTGNIVTFGNLRDGLHSLHYADGILVGVLFHFEVAERKEAAVELFSIKHSHIFSDISFSFKPFYSLERRGGREVDGLGEFFDRQTGIILKSFQYSDVGAVECGCRFHCMKWKRIIFYKTDGIDI